jgi:glycosyltransferase involved in cell wall biosynthesis
MSSVSGIDGLVQSLLQISNGPAITSIFPSEFGHSPPLSRWNRVCKRLLGRFQTKSPNRSYSTPVSPFVSQCHTECAKALVDLLESDPRMFGLLLAGEEQYAPPLVDAPPSIRSRIIVMLHQPPSWHRLYWKDSKTLDGVRAVICLCSTQKNYFESVCSSPIVQIRHGVSLDHFSPPVHSRKNNRRLLFVGQWLRDFNTLFKSMQQIWQHDESVSIDCVVPYQARQTDDMLQFARDDRVRWHANLSSVELLELYRSAVFLFLPVIDATANNAVVEALACGLPIVSSDLGGIRNYVNEQSGILCAPGDACGFAQAAIRLLNNDALRNAASESARAFAEKNLSWPSIAQELLNALAIC